MIHAAMCFIFGHNWDGNGIGPCGGHQPRRTCTRCGRHWPTAYLPSPLLPPMPKITGVKTIAQVRAEAEFDRAILEARVRREKITKLIAELEALATRLGNRNASRYVFGNAMLPDSLP
jgi:hypothetical protein